MAQAARRLAGSTQAALLAAGPAVARDDAPPQLTIPGAPPPVGVPGPGDAGRRPDADIFREFGHEFGTVTPGGGARAGRVPDGGMVIGPGGVIGSGGLGSGGQRPPQRAERKPPPRPTPQEKQAEIRRALVPHVAVALARRKTLDELYAKLAAATDESEAKGVASLINAIWQRSPSDTANLLMSRADTAMAAQDYPAALRVLDRLVALQPDWAEAWNRRATVRFLAGNLDGSMADVEHVLKLEPKHFAALSGLAMILQRTGFDKQALQVYRRSAAVYPHRPDVEQAIEKLSLEVEGQGI